MREFVTLPNFITSGNLAAGFLALTLLPDRPVVALMLILLAALLDSIDGPMARRRGKDQTFGAGLDSLADLVSFGVAPALAVYLVPGATAPFVALPVAVLFAVCGAWRLARFPLVKRKRHFVGLPIPVAGILTMLLAATNVPLAWVLPATLALSLLMVSTVPFPTVPMVGRGARFLVRRSGRRGANQAEAVSAEH